MLQKISWWDWKEDELVKNVSYFNENIENFCDMFYGDADQRFEAHVSQRRITDDRYFAFADFYENYSTYPVILTSFMTRYSNDKNKTLILFIRDDCVEGEIEKTLYDELKELADIINKDPAISCSIEFRNGNFDDARDCFLNCSHYVVSRTYGAVYFSCLVDKLGMTTISGVDSFIQWG